MYLKIYFQDKPLFLCDQVTPDIEPFRHHDDAVFIDEFSTPAVKSMIHEMEQQKVHAGIFVHPDLAELKKAFWKKFTVIQAAGGVVTNEKGEILFIHRRGKWDLPKGKLDEGETLEQCAVREVMEETGLKKVELREYLVTTYHTYHESGKHILKESYWYQMQVSGKQDTMPQTEEDILEIRWIQKDSIDEMLSNTFPSIVDVMKAFQAAEHDTF
jgi:ADP-ribose pyrophosphatase YjhB (NUDIX family)